MFGENVNDLFLKAKEWLKDIYEKKYLTTEVLLYAILKQDYNTIQEVFVSLNMDQEFLIKKIEQNILKYDDKTSTIVNSDEYDILLSKIDDKTSLIDLFLLLFNDEFLSSKILKLSGQTKESFKEEYGLIFDSSSGIYIEQIEKEEKPNINHGKEFDYITVLQKNDIKLIGRDLEVNLCLETLERNVKKNILLLGAAGVGKTMLVESLTNYLTDKIIHKVDFNKMVAGTKFRGDLELRYKNFIEEYRNKHNIVLFFDECHMLVNGGGMEDSISLLNVLKEPMARGELQIIMATTKDEYNKYFKHDEAIIRRVNTVYVDSTDKKTSLIILKNFSKKHDIKINSSTLEMIYDKSHHHFPNKHMPDIGLEVLDSTIAKKRRIVKTKKQLLNKKQLQFLKNERIKIMKSGDYDTALELKQQLLNLKKDINANVTITQKDVLLTFKQNYQINIDMNKTTLKESYNNLCNIILGQNNIIKEVLKLIYIHKKTKNNAPLSLFFKGSSGLGKSELCIQLSKTFTNNKILKIDCTAYSSPHSIEALIGAPPSYVGFQHGGILTNYIVANPNAFILFDNIEEAHPNLHNLLLPILNEGVLNDRLGKTYSFKNSIIGFTSSIKNRKKVTFIDEDDNDDISNNFTPEFINRLGGIFTLRQLSKEDYVKLLNKNEQVNLLSEEEKRDIIETQIKDNLSVRKFFMNIKKKANDKMLKTINF